MAKKDGALHLAQLQERGIRRVLHTIARESTQNLLRLGGAKTQRSGKFDHLVVMLSNKFPPDGTREHRLQVGVGIRVPRFGAIELLSAEIFQAGKQLETQHRTGTKPDLALDSGINAVAIHLRRSGTATRA